MSLIKVGDTIINLDHVTYANKIADGYVVMTYNAPTEEGPALWHSFKGAEANALWGYLSGLALSISVQ